MPRGIIMNTLAVQPRTRSPVCRPPPLTSIATLFLLFVLLLPSDLAISQVSKDEESTSPPAGSDRAATGGGTASSPLDFLVNQGAVAFVHRFGELIPRDQK